MKIISAHQYGDIQELTIERRRWYWPFAVARETWIRNSKKLHYSYWYCSTRPVRCAVYSALDRALDTAWEQRCVARSYITELRDALDRQIGPL
jgi:hypothetical protein